MSLSHYTRYYNTKNEGVSKKRRERKYAKIINNPSSMGYMPENEKLGALKRGFFGWPYVVMKNNSGRKYWYKVYLPKEEEEEIQNFYDVELLVKVIPHAFWDFSLFFNSYKWYSNEEKVSLRKYLESEEFIQLFLSHVSKHSRYNGEASIISYKIEELEEETNIVQDTSSKSSGSESNGNDDNNNDSNNENEEERNEENEKEKEVSLLIEAKLKYSNPEKVFLKSGIANLIEDLVEYENSSKNYEVPDFPLQSFYWKDKNTGKPIEVRNLYKHDLEHNYFSRYELVSVDESFLQELEEKYINLQNLINMSLSSENKSEQQQQVQEEEEEQKQTQGQEEKMEEEKDKEVKESEQVMEEKNEEKEGEEEKEEGELNESESEMDVDNEKEKENIMNEEDNNDIEQKREELKDVVLLKKSIISWKVSFNLLLKKIEIY